MREEFYLLLFFGGVTSDKIDYVNLRIQQNAQRKASPLREGSVLVRDATLKASWKEQKEGHAACRKGV
jgi:hypothetical protein